ncbi:MAG TPA: zinc dependent phospholipase C family protein [bacterium]|nr:zinc dependent phospholipase C family protein [bacterium]HPN30466.1 zinc dependent phospholipase C family protein [bacterium]
MPIVFVVLIIFFIPEPVFAWGPSSHLVFTSYILTHLSVIASVPVKKILASSQLDFFYGCIAPDIFVGKGSLPKKHHSHNWETGFKIYKKAGSDSEKGFALGYLTHLSADAVSHNFFVPFNLFSKKIKSLSLSHIYWELLFDMKLPEFYRDFACFLVEFHNPENDSFLKKNISYNKTFSMRKSLFYNIIKMQNAKILSKAMKTPRFSKKILVLNDDIFDKFIKTNIGICIDVINNLDSSFVCDYDPVGSENLTASPYLSNLNDGNPFILPEILKINAIKNFNFKFLSNFTNYKKFSGFLKKK